MNTNICWKKKSMGLELEIFEESSLLWVLEFCIAQESFALMEDHALWEESVSSSWFEVLGDPLLYDVSIFFRRCCTAEEIGEFLDIRGAVPADKKPLGYRFYCLKNESWVEKNIATFPAFSVGSFHIRGSHVQEGRGPISLVIDASTAFGTGEHASTQGCLLALIEGVKRFLPGEKKILDMGCGSGILGIAAYFLVKRLLCWPLIVHAVDIDDEALRMTAVHRDKNKISQNFFHIFHASRGPKTWKRSEDYDVIVANILARPLRVLSLSLIKCLKKGGILILSGFLPTEKFYILNIYLCHGNMVLYGEYNVNGWMTLVLQKKR